MPVLDWRRSPDERNANFPMRAALPTHVPRKSKLWTAARFRLDQGEDGACTGFGSMNELLASPVRVVLKPNTLDNANAQAFKLYHRAQQLDEWPGEDYEGSSVNGAAKALREGGFISSWTWASNVEDVIDAIITTGPVVIGIPWHTSMFTPDHNGLLSLGGQVEGGHCVCLTGYSTTKFGLRNVLRLRNSWGAEWGIDGDAYISAADLNGLLIDGGGEAALFSGRSLGK